MALRLGEITRRLGAQCAGPENLELCCLAPPQTARADDLSFVPHPRLRNALVGSAAGAVVVAARDRPLCRRAAPVVVQNVLLATAEAAQWLQLRSREAEARTRDVQVYESIAGSVSLGPGVIVGRAVTIGEHSRIEAGCVIGDGVRIGSYCEVKAGVSIGAAATLGNRVRIGSGTVIGDDAFTYVRKGTRWMKLPDFGSVEIGDDVDIGARSTIDRGAIGDTRIKRGSKLDKHVHVGHGVVIGEDVAIAARTSIAGEATIGDGCIIGGAVGINEGVGVAPYCRITAMSMVTKSLPQSGASYSSGWPAESSIRWWRNVARLRRGAPRTV